MKRRSPQALDAHRLWGYGADVFTVEPPPPGHPLIGRADVIAHAPQRRPDRRRPAHHGGHDRPGGRRRPPRRTTARIRSTTPTRSTSPAEAGDAGSLSIESQSIDGF